MAVAVLAASLILAGPLLAQTPSFPGAYGFGSQAAGGRGGTVYHVTNLNDSGAGSFRDAVSQGDRIVVFDVGGYVHLQSAVSVSSNITIAGQTAPGGGIGIMGAEVSLSNHSNIIVRDVRFRQGSLDPLRGKSALNMGEGSDIILDHCSFEFGQWDSIDAVKTSDFTVQNSIIADPIYQRFGSHVERGPSTFYRNLWVNAHNRQPLAKDNTQYINNIVYDYQLGYTVANTGGYFSHDIVNNYFISGPATTNAYDNYFQMNNKQSVYAVGNFLDSSPDGVLNGSADNNVGPVVVLTSPWAPTTNAIPTISAQDAFTSVVESAGSFPRDPLDSFVVAQVNSLGTQGQMYNDQSDTGLSNGGYGDIASGEPFTDTDGDGIADYWAIANGLSTADSSVGSAMYENTGYTNLEVYVNSLVLPEPWTAQSLAGPSTQAASSYNPFTRQWLLISAGQGTSSTPDQAEYASQIMQGDGSVIARVESMRQANANEAKQGLGPQGNAGVMLRASTAPDAAFVFASVKADHEIELDWRSAQGGEIQSSFVPGSASVKQAVWLKLTRLGNLFTASFSVDGSNWMPIGAANAVMGSDALAGLALCAADPQEQTLATFTDVGLLP
jgi:hypothetical protein